MIPFETFEEKINKISEDEQISLMNNGRIIAWIHNPSEKVKLAAVKNDGLAIQHIPEPSIEIQLAAVNQNTEAMYYIKNPSEKIFIEAIRKNPTVMMLFHIIYGNFKWKIDTAPIIEEFKKLVPNWEIMFDKS